jgi:2'-5' RNA ligase
VTKEGRGAATVAGDERFRLFCALQLADDTVACLTAWRATVVQATESRATVGQAAAARVRLVPPESLHVTLAFLGHRPAAEVPAVAAELRAAAAAAHPVELRPQRYRETRSVGMIVLEDVGGAAAALAEDVQARLERLGVYRRERRRWLPHVTVLRFSEPAGLRLDPPNTCSIHAVRAALYRSVLGAGGARYEIVYSGALGGR